MLSKHQSTTIVLASVAVFLLIYVVKQQMTSESSAEGLVGAIMSRIPTKNAKSVVKNTSLDFVSDSIKNQGLGVGRLQDDFVQEQYSSDLGVGRLQDDFVQEQYSSDLGAKRPGGMKIDPSGLKNNSFFSTGTQNASRLAPSGISAEGAQAFPFATKSGPERDEELRTTSNGAGDVASSEPVGRGMKLSRFLRKQQDNKLVRDGDRASKTIKSIASMKMGVAPFDDDGAVHNPFVGSTTDNVGKGMNLSDAYTTPNVGMGSTLTNAYGDLGVAVSPISSADVGVSPEEISAATASLSGINLVQSMPTAHIDRFIRP